MTTDTRDSTARPVSAAPRHLHGQPVPQPIRLLGLSKTFGARKVLDDVSFTIEPGTVHGLLGANGSGKSTAIKILAGYHEPDDESAVLEIGGVTHRFPLSRATRREVGIGVVHQDLGLAMGTIVAENLFIDDLAPSHLSVVSRRDLAARARQLLQRVGGEHIDPRAQVGRLPAVDRAVVAIARAMSALQPGGLLVLDEVTTFLPRDGVDLLFRLMRGVCGEGTSVLFVSHRLEEVRAVCRDVTVLRGGAVAARQRVADISDDQLVTDIVGASLNELYPSKHAKSDVTRLGVRHVIAKGIGPITFDARAGEIVGITGLRGMGHEHLPYILYGDRAATGTITVDGVAAELRGARVPRMIGLGMRLVPGDRLKQGAVGHATVQENVTLPFVHEFFARGRLCAKRERIATQELLDSYGVVPRDPAHVYNKLSGGNQQKVLLGRWLRTTPKVLLLDEPTQGVDVGARRDLFGRIVEAARDGATVLYVSTETQDLAELCHRVLVFRDGAVSAVLEGDEVTEENILRACWLSTAA